MDFMQKHRGGGCGQIVSQLPMFNSLRCDAESHTIKVTGVVFKVVMLVFFYIYGTVGVCFANVSISKV